jgi:soluble lytic murein transglycosylase
MRRGFWVFAVLLLVSCAAASAAAVNVRYPVRYAEVIKQHAGDLELPLLFSVIKTESGFRPYAQSHKDASGLMQLTPPTALWMAEVMGIPGFEPDMVWEPEINIAIGAYFLNWLVRYYDGDLTLALCAYNAGMGNVNQWLNDPRYSGDGRNLHAIPFPETAQYIQRVYFNRRVYEMLLRVRRIR